MACRSEAKAQEATKEIRKEDPSANLEFLSYDASSLRAVHEDAGVFVARNTPLDILLLDAGAIVDMPRSSSDGLEWGFAVNHLAHFALVMGLMASLERAAAEAGHGDGDVRIVSTTSAGFRMHPDPESLRISDEDLDVGDGYRGWWGKSDAGVWPKQDLQRPFHDEVGAKVESNESGKVSEVQ